MDMRKIVCAVALSVFSQIPLQAADDSHEAKGLITFANQLYKEKKFTKAAAEYAGYIIENPKGEHVAQANYRMDESLLKNGNTKEAIKAFTAVAEARPASDYAAPASYRLGSLYYNDKEFARAVPHFEFAATASPKQMIKLSALYYAARSLRMNMDSKKAIEAFKAVVEEGADSNPYRDAAKLAIAELHIERGDADMALPYLEELVDPGHPNTKIQERAAEALESIEKSPK